MEHGSWTIVHGDTSRSPCFAVLTRGGVSVDLDSDAWVVRAQARADVDSQDLIFGWSEGRGIELSRATVELSTGRRIQTSTVGLSILPGEFSQLPRDWSGVVEIEVASDSTPSPAQRFTVARIDTRIVPDITHDGGTLIVAPGLPAPNAPAGGVLAGNYPNPIFAVPMASRAEMTSAIAEASIADRLRANHSGSMSADNLIDGANIRAYTAAERNKLTAIPADATHNSPDAFLLNRANHTGPHRTLNAGLITDFAESVQDTMGASFRNGPNVSIIYDDSTGTFTISAAGGSGGGSGGVSGVRTVTADVTALPNEVIFADASTGPVAVSPPPSPAPGTQITVVKVDPSSNAVTWSGATNSETSRVFTRRWSGATFTYQPDLGRWVVTAIGEDVVVRVSSVNGRTGDVVGLAEQAALTEHVGAVNNPHAVTKDQVGLGSVDNTADASKPVSTAQQAAIDGRVPTSRQVVAGTGLTGGGALSADRTLAVAYGTAAGTAAQGNDIRVVNAVQTSQRGPVGGHQILTYASTVTVDAASGSSFRVDATGALTLGVSGGAVGQHLMVVVLASGGDRVVTMASGVALTDGTTASYTIPTGKLGYFGVRIDADGPTLLAQTKRT